MFMEVIVSIEGEYTSSTTFHDEAEVRDYVSYVGEEAREDGYLTEVFVKYHAHGDEDECECVVDYYPDYTFGESRVFQVAV